MALTQTLTHELDAYAIGQKIRDLRTEKKLGLVELGNHTGLSAALLSKIERGRMYPTLPTLLRISLVFGVGLDYFFNMDPRVFSVVRRKERQRFPEKPGGEGVSFHFESLDFPAKRRQLHAYLADFHPMPIDDVKLHRHRGAEFIYVLEGKLGLYIQDGETTLEEGDATYFDSVQKHGYRRVGRKACRAVVVVVPQATGGV